MSIDIQFPGSPESFPFPIADLRREAERVVSELLDQLGSPAAAGRMLVRFADGVGHADASGVVLPQSFPGYATVSPLGEYAACLKHEAAHHLVQVMLGWNPRPIAFLNEGLAQSQAEGKRIRSAFGFDYHDLAAARVMAGLAVPLRSIMTNEVFLPARSRHRAVIALNASFVQWLIDSHGMGRFKSLFEQVSSPHPRHGYAFAFLPTLRSIYARDLEGLEADWRDALQSSPANLQAIAHDRAYGPGPDLTNLPGCCPCCCNQVRGEDDCPVCGCPRTQAISILP